MPMAFPDAWNTVLAEDEQLAAGAAAEQRAAAIVQSHKSLLLPQIDVVASYTHLEKPVELDALALDPLHDIASSAPGQALIDFVGGEDWFVTPVSKQDVVRSSLVALWPLYTGGKIKAATDIARLSEVEATALLAEMRRLRFTSLAATYYGTVLAQHVTDTLNTTVDTLAQHVSAAKKREQQGQLAKVERMSMEVAYEEARLKASQAAQKRDTINNALSSLVHAQTKAEPSSPLFVHATVPALEPLLAGLHEHPSLQVLAAKESKAKALAKASRGLYHPSVFMFGSYHLYDNNDYADDITPDWFVGLGLRMPLVDRAGRRHKTAAADNAVAEAAHLQTAMLRKLTVLLERQHSEVEQALSEYHSLEHSVTLAEEVVHLQERAFAEGLARSLDVIDAQNALTTAKTRQQAAAAHYVIALSQLLTLAGQEHVFFDYLQQGEPVL